jgi:hypothetical protein
VRDWQSPADLFVSRAAELDGVAEILRRAAAGQPWLVAIEGDPGMGKTALARRPIEGTRVLAARAGQAEADLDYGLANLGNIYAKCGLQGRQQLRRYVGQWHQPAAV